MLVDVDVDVVDDDDVVVVVIGGVTVFLTRFFAGPDVDDDDGEG